MHKKIIPRSQLTCNYHLFFMQSHKYSLYNVAVAISMLLLHEIANLFQKTYTVTMNQIDQAKLVLLHTNKL